MRYVTVILNNSPSVQIPGGHLRGAQIVLMTFQRAGKGRVLSGERYRFVWRELADDCKQTVIAINPQGLSLVRKNDPATLVSSLVNDRQGDER